MNQEEIFAAWSPDDSPWSLWTKPVLFAHLDSIAITEEMPARPEDITWCPLPLPLPINNVVVVVDLPGAESVQMGLALAGRGYCPVPLYNALPLPTGQPMLNPERRRNVAAVNVLPIIAALRMGAETLAGLAIPPSAPPAFLLDSNRHGAWFRVEPDEFDNRSVCFTTDFPSANFLLAHGFRRAMLVQRDGNNPRSDLAHVLRRWQEGGMALEIKCVDSPTPPERLEVARPSWYGAMFQRALAAFGLRRAPGGGFGAWVPESSAGG